MFVRRCNNAFLVLAKADIMENTVVSLWRAKAAYNYNYLSRL